MTDFKRRTLYLTTGKQLRLYGNSMAIGSSLEIGEGSAPNIFSFLEQATENNIIKKINSDPEEGEVEKVTKKRVVTMQNPHRLTAPDLLEIADYNIQLWQDLKKNIRKYGVNDPKVFNQEALR